MRSEGPSAATAVVGVIGDPVAHSLSPRLHNGAFAALGLDWVSVGFPVEAGDTVVALRGAGALGLRGLSVTMPHKAAAAAVVDRLGGEAERLGAVNCVAYEDGVAVGENTDGAGFLAALWRGAHFVPAGKRCLVVGAGGAGRAVVAALADAGAVEVVVVNRSAERAAAAAALAGEIGQVGREADAAHCDLVVNATPVGMPPPVASAGAGPKMWPVDPALLRGGQLVVDLIYDPRRTPWLDAAEAAGASAVNGMGMLVHQAALQITRWTGEEAPVEAMWRVVVAEAEVGDHP